MAYTKLREELGYPLIKDPAERAKWVKPAAPEDGGGGDPKPPPAKAARPKEVRS